MKKIAIFFLKLALILLIFAWLFYRASRDNAWERISQCHPNGWLILTAFLLALSGTLITFVRWGWLVRALGVPISLRQTLRLGAIGYVFNLSPMGIVGGDLVKGILLANQSPGAKAACAVSVIVDRVIGLYAMFITGIFGIAMTGFWRETAPVAVFSTRLVLGLFALSSAGLIFLLIPESRRKGRRRLLRAIPLAGPLFEKLYAASNAYSRHWGVLTGSLLATFAVHGLFTLSLWAYARGLYGYAPTCLEHLVIYPTANCGTIIPLSAGPLEYYLDLLYPLFPVAGQETAGAGYGSMIGIISRIGMIINAAIGGVFCLMSRSEIGAALEQIREDEARQKSKPGLKPESKITPENGNQEESAGGGGIA